MIGRVAITVFTLSLAGCYTPNHDRLAVDVQALVAPGMTMAEAITNLESKGFQCDAKSMQPATTCVRTHQQVVPSTCIERVNLRPTADLTAVQLIELPNIMCAGL